VDNIIHSKERKMPFVKVVKNKAYFKRFEVKYRRRRECKTDYQQRRRLIVQDKNKYACPKYRFVVRKTNTKIICQIIAPTIQGDKVICAVNSKQLIAYGLTAGLTNYAASYCTGLLCARRLLTNLKMNELYKGQEEATGGYYDVLKQASAAERRPFKAYLDVGLTRTTVGNRAFAAMKGACDGGLCIPHSKNIFPGYKVEEKKKIFDVEKHRQHIFGLHVQEYMEHLKGDNPEQYKRHFRLWLECIAKNKVESLEDLYKKLHKEIREKPQAPAKPDKKIVQKYDDAKKTVHITAKGKYKRDRKLTNAERKAKVQAQISEVLKQVEMMKKPE
jgi:large subunit ribosomal protein L5e